MTDGQGIGARHADLATFLRRGGCAALAAGPVAILFMEDEVEIDSTIRHHLGLGFRTVLAMMPDALPLAPDLAGKVVRIGWDRRQDRAVTRAVNALAAAAPGQWFYYCFNAEYLFYPFCESRTVGELLAFHASERRQAMLTYVIDIYAPDLSAHPDGVDIASAHLDRVGYYALARPDPANGGRPRERQLDFFGGLKWRFEEHVPPERRRIDRIALFQARKGVLLRGDHTFTDEEYNTYACPWHNNLTAAIASFRTAKALMRNPASTFEIDSFLWHNSVPFEWNSRQLLDLGLIEPGQWF